MTKVWKLSFYLLLFGVLTLVSVLFKTPAKREFGEQEVLGAKTNLTLFVEPNDGRQPLLDVIDSSQKEILLEVYLFSDSGVETALAEAKKRGVLVNVIMEQNPFGGSGLNQKMKPVLENDGITVHWSNPSFTFTHEKTLIVDGKIVCILNMNLTKTAFTKNREYNSCDENPEDVTEAKNIFLADWDRKNYSPTQGNLVVSPDNSRGKLTAFIKSAKKSLDIEMEVLEDSRTIDLIAEKAKQIPVRIILASLTKVDSNKNAVEKLKVKTLSSPYVHAKLILVDGQRTYLGSVNLSSQSFDQNRELGLLISQPDVIEKVEQTFENDWKMAQ